MSLRYLGGFITASYNPLKVPNPPTIVSATAGVGQVSVAFTAPSNVGGSAITSFIVLVTDSSNGDTFSNTGAASPIVVTGLTAGNTYTAKVSAVNSYGPSAFSAPSGSFVPIAPKLYSWGQNNNGQLGQNNTIALSSPVQVGSDTSWLTLAAGGGGYNFAAIKSSGQLWTWGSNNNGQLGQNNTINRSSPVQVGALTNWESAAIGGDNFTLSIKTNGQLWSWGKNNNGQLGQNNIVNSSSPVQVGALTDWKVLDAGNSFCIAVKTNGTLWSWGNNYYGQLGQNDPTYRSSPVQVGVLTTWAKVSTGVSFTSAITTDGTLFTWGQNSEGQLGQNNTARLSSPIQVGALTDWLQISSGYYHCAAIKTNGTLWTWGANSKGELGQNNVIRRSSPVQVGSLTDWSKVSASGSFCSAIKTDGTLWTWGQNTQGQLGLNNTSYRSSPVQVGSLTTWLSVSGISKSTLAILS